MSQVCQLMSLTLSASIWLNRHRIAWNAMMSPAALNIDYEQIQTKFADNTAHQLYAERPWRSRAAPAAPARRKRWCWPSAPTTSSQAGAACSLSDACCCGVSCQHTWGWPRPHQPPIGRKYKYLNPSCAVLCLTGTAMWDVADSQYVWATS